MLNSMLHCYEHYAHHTDVIIAGNREGLLQLRDSLNAVLNGEEPLNSFNTFANDGEGFTCHTVLLSDADMDRSPVPYTADYLNVKHKLSEPPYSLVYKYHDK